MRIPVAFVADEANVSAEGKLNVLGIFDRMAAPQFPVQHPRMVFAFRVEADAADGGRVFPVRVRLEDERGDTLFHADGDLSPPTVPAGEFSTANQVFALVGVQFPHAGLYRFVVEVGDAATHETRFLVQQQPLPTELN